MINNLSWSMVERSLVFTRFKVEKDRSAEQDVMGIAKAIPYTRTSVGYASINLNCLLVKIDKQYEINLLFSDNRFITLYSEIIEVTLEDLKKEIK